MCLNDELKHDHFTNREANKKSFSLWIEIDQLKKAINTIKRVRKLKGLTFDQWWQDTITEYEQAFPPIAYDPVNLIADWYSEHEAAKVSVSDCRSILVNHMIKQADKLARPKPISDKRFDQWWQVFKSHLDQEALDLMAMLSMTVEIQNILKSRFMVNDHD